MRRVVEICLGSVLVAGLLFAVVWAGVHDHVSDREKMCRGIRISVLDSASNKFTNRAMLKKIIDRDFGGYVNRPVDSVNLWKAENTLNEQKCIKWSRAYFTSDGIFHIDVIQRTPVYRLVCRGKIAYIDMEGTVMKVDRDWCQGIPSVLARDGVKEGHQGKMAAFITILQGADILDGLRDSIWCNASGDIFMKRKGKAETYLLGQPVRMEEKAENIKIYETEIKPGRKGENAYTTVNFKNKGQIVCK